jgi:hypothetical protein
MLVMVVWYLMMPPPGGDGPDKLAPLGDWIIDSVYTGRSACEHGLRQFRQSLPGYLRAHTNSQPFVAWILQAAPLAACVGIDDPRLESGNAAQSFD